MRCMKKLVLILCLFLFGPYALANRGERVNQLMDQLTLDQKLGQLLLVGFRGTQVDGNTEIQRAIREAHVGSVILFDYDATTRTRGRNINSPSQLARLTRDLKALAPHPLFISVDEEGGLVSRLHPRYGFRRKPKPSDLMGLGIRRARQEMSALATELHQHGINLNFAPLADVNTNPQNPVIGSLGRSFSENPESVARMAGEFVDAQSRAGVISVLKHFPGHGSSHGDSHLGVVDVTETWSADELIPFRELIKQGKAPMIMTAHIYQRELDPHFPATLSPAILTDLLRGELGFEGVIISDDMNMRAITDQFGREEAMVRALNAGVDLLLLGNNLDYDSELALKAHAELKAAVRDGRLSLRRIDESVRRILTLKLSR